ncbi:uncharacterized protein LOC143288133 isoform X2 [Babylonia areolata]|uniref:uncharacterized protein LOC143288133 isoform X2 n=1 Tax=Babylonia areolata TaxID=304850 RepID=UPI003FD4C070
MGTTSVLTFCLCAVTIHSMVTPVRQEDGDPQSETHPRGSWYTYRGSHKHRGRRLPDPALLTLPDLLQQVKDMGLVYTERPVFNLTVVELNDRGSSSHFCPEKIYFTLDFNRVPMKMLHRKCDHSKLSHSRCLTADRSFHSLVCRDFRSYRKVKVMGRRMYQEVFHGCGCDASGKLV